MTLNQLSHSGRALSPLSMWETALGSHQGVDGIAGLKTADSKLTMSQPCAHQVPPLRSTRMVTYGQ